VFLLCMVILGGLGSVWGVVLAGAILTWLNQEGLANIGGWVNRETPLRFDVTEVQFGIYGVIIVLIMLSRPIGLIPESRHKRELEEGGLASDTLYGERHE
jgi:branched-chain amino acid transport system permease protein